MTGRRRGHAKGPPQQAATFRFSVELLDRARVVAMLRRVPMCRLVEEGLREHLERLLAEDPALAQAVTELLPHLRRVWGAPASEAST
jgi:hypothetical protein